MNPTPDQEILWSRQLIREFQSICHFHGICMDLPCIDICESQVRYGSWTPGSRTLSISRHLIDAYPWNVVIEILKHEMAHQYVSEILKEDDIHGPVFQEACRKLGVHPDFRKAFGPITAELLTRGRNLSSRARLMIDKVEKLLSLARSDNVHEARLASRKANELIQRHNLDRFENLDPGEGVRATHMVITHRKKRIESLQKSILGILRDFYFVDTVTSTIFDPHEGNSFRSIVLFGLPENLKVAEYIYTYLFRTGTRLWKESRNQHGYPMKEKVSFDMGFASGIRKTLEKSMIPKIPASSNTALIALNTLIEKENQAERFRVFPRLRKVAYGAHRRGAAYTTGYEKGITTRIQKSVLHRETESPLLLIR